MTYIARAIEVRVHAPDGRADLDTQDLDRNLDVVDDSQLPACVAQDATLGQDALHDRVAWVLLAAVPCSHGELDRAGRLAGETDIVDFAASDCGTIVWVVGLGEVHKER